MVNEAIAHYAARRPSGQIPGNLVKEEFDGVRAYRRGFREVLGKTKTLEDIMGCSSLQWFILDYLLRQLYLAVDEDRFMVATNEAGIHLAHRRNFSVDAAVFDSAVLRPDMISKKYVNVPPTLSIEVDVDFEMNPEETNLTVPDFIQLKINALHDFGVERILWVMSETRQVLVSEKGRPTATHDWHEDIELWRGHTMNIGAYLAQKNIRT
ncbi:MAG: Uma2 family endonuclease [Saprospiraceae bacterium]